MAQDPATNCRHSPGHREPLRVTPSPPASSGEGGGEEAGSGDGQGYLVRRGTSEVWEGGRAEQGCAPKSGKGSGEAVGTVMERISRD